MLEFAAFTYTLLASFVLSSADRNCRQARPHQPMLKLVGIVLMTMSLTLAMLLFATAAYMVLTR